MSPKTYSIGICVRYENEVYTQALVHFYENEKFVVSYPTGKYHKLKSGNKLNPHSTYYANGLYHVGTYTTARYLPDNIRYPVQKTKQPLDASFSGWENVDVQGFSRNDAKVFGRLATGFDDTVIVNAEDIREKWSPAMDDEMNQDLGEIPAAPLPTALSHVDLLEPNRYDLTQKTVAQPERIMQQKMVKQTYPWCLITIVDGGVD